MQFNGIDIQEHAISAEIRELLFLMVKCHQADKFHVTQIAETVVRHGNDASARANREAVRKYPDTKEPSCPK
ncbi:MAG: hypothetical protein FWC75_07120 [Oscillospiraceae bacterium]|nr:hypothetical protein [Oscillospiraceae bacterium]